MPGWQDFVPLSLGPEGTAVWGRPGSAGGPEDGGGRMGRPQQDSPRREKAAYEQFNETGRASMPTTRSEKLEWPCATAADPDKTLRPGLREDRGRSGRAHDLTETCKLTSVHPQHSLAQLRLQAGRAAFQMAEVGPAVILSWRVESPAAVRAGSTFELDFRVPATISSACRISNRWSAIRYFSTFLAGADGHPPTLMARSSSCSAGAALGLSQELPRTRLLLSILIHPVVHKPGDRRPDGTCFFL